MTYQMILKKGFFLRKHTFDNNNVEVLMSCLMQDQKIIV